MHARVACYRRASALRSQIIKLGKPRIAMENGEPVNDHRLPEAILASCQPSIQSVPNN